jgi:hypothetical protein
MLLIGLACVPACKTTLEPGGAYAPLVGTNVQSDVTFYAIESAFEVAYKSIDFVFKFEFDNRDLLFKVSPEIKRSLDAIRPKAVQIRDDYMLARIVYRANSTPANLDALQQVLQKLQQLLATAEAIMKTKGTAQ